MWRPLFYVELMSYLVLARKWRPQTFDEVQGQEVIVKTLRQALKTGRVAHAFLFCGSRGTGKTTLARILAKALCCEKGITAQPCGVCSVCTSITEGSCLDVVEIDGASNTGVDDVRELKESLRYQPNHARFKVIIIDEVHMLSTNAFNALLKTLEEPPEHVKFILATTEHHKIPVTILSRCQRYDLKRLKVAVIYEQVMRILQQEGLSIRPEGVRLIAQVADGGMRDALSLTDQVLSFAPENASLDEVSSILGVTSRKTVVDMAMALLNREFQGAFKLIEDASASGIDLRKFADSVATEIRHLSVARATQSVSSVIDLSEDEIREIESASRRYELQDLQRVFALLLDGIDQISRSEQPRLNFELICLRILDRPDGESLASIAQAISRLESLSQKHIKGELTTRIEQPREPVSPKPQAPQVPQVSQVPQVAQASQNLGTPFDARWMDFVNEIAQMNPSVGVYLEHGRPQKTPTVYFENRFYKDRVLEVCKESWFKGVLTRIYGSAIDITWILEETAALDRKPTETATMSIRETRDLEKKNTQVRIEESARNHPVVKKALALFGGEIKAVKPSAGQD